MITIPSIKQLCRKNSPTPLIECMQILQPILSDMASQINALTGEVIESVSLVHDSDSKACIQLVKENGESIQSPEYGIEIWEDLDLSNLPTNFAEGQDLMITFLDTIDELSSTNWTTAPTTNPTRSANTTIERTIRFKLKSNTIQGSVMLGVKTSQTAISFLEFMVEDIQYLNNTGDNITMFQLIPVGFNGGGAQEGTGLSIMRSNITSYIESIKRKL